MAALFACTRQNRIDNIDYILIPQACFTSLALTIVEVKVPELHPILSERHREVLGLQDQEVTTSLARTILSSSELTVCRLRVKDLMPLVQELLEGDPTIRDYLGGEWLDKV